jgi:proliferating cell nuclear antigen
MTDFTNGITDNISDDSMLYIHTKKIPAIKSLIEALKEIFRDVNIKFTPKVEKQLESDPSIKKVTGGMYITALNSNSNILVRLHLEADKFCNYSCKPADDKPYVMIGVNMSNLFKIIKFLNNDEELYMLYDKHSMNQLNLQYVNRQKNLTTNYHLNLLDLKEENYNIGKQSFDFVITMPSNDFHTLIKNMSVIAEQVDIKFINTKNGYSLSFNCRGEFASQESVFDGKTNIVSDDKMVNVTKNMTEVENKESKDNEKEDNENNQHEIDDNEHTIIQGVYELRALSLFSRCSSLCPTIDLYIKNDSPLVIKYRVADMGSVHLILSPINDTDGIEDDSETASDNESDKENI